MDAYFNGKRTVLNQEQLDTVFNEYIDTAGLYDLDEFNKVAYAQFLSNRINFVKSAIELQRLFFKEFSRPYTPNFKFFKKYGYTLIDDHTFLEQLENVENGELKWVAQLEIKMKELIDERKKKKKSNEEPKAERGSFVKTLNSLGKIGYKISKNETTMEDLAFMIKEETDK